MLIPTVISDQFRYVGALSSIVMGGGSQVGQRLLDRNSVGELMLDFTGVHAN